MRQKCLMLGAGMRRPQRLFRPLDSFPEEHTDWVTLDHNPESSPDVVFDLEKIENGESLPFPESVFDEVHAYEVLEHFGRQGDFRGFFSTFRALWRVIKPSGWLIGSSPSWRSPWLWGDPGHTRAITEEALGFLDQEHYEQLGKTPSSDYRSLVAPCWWSLEFAREIGPVDPSTNQTRFDTLVYGLRAKK